MLKQEVAGANLMGSDLYNNLIHYFVTHLKGLRNVSALFMLVTPGAEFQAKQETDLLHDEALLRYYAAEWLRYTTGANYINRLFTYLNRHWVKRERDEGRKAVYPVYTVNHLITLVKQAKTTDCDSSSLLCNGKTIYSFLYQNKQTKLASAILRLIEDQRNGDVIDHSLVKKVVDSFVSLGLDDTDTNKACLDVYKDHFEIPFIEATEKYYKQESESFLASNSISDYLKKAEGSSTEEEDRVERYLNTQTRKPLISKCEHVLIREHADLMWESFQGLLDFDKDEDLQRMYSLLSRIPEGLEPLRKKFEEHVKKAGLAAVSKLVGEAGETTDTLDPKHTWTRYLRFTKRNSETVSRSFRGEAGFVASLDKACREFRQQKRSHRHFPILNRPNYLPNTPTFCYRKNNKLAEEDDLEVALNRVVCAVSGHWVLILSKLLVSFNR